MAKYTITYACGCTEVKQLYGTYASRDSYVAWAKNHECHNCKKAKEAKEAEAKALENNYPSLTGSEKQIAWAMTIRNKFIDLINGKLEIAMSKVNDSNREKAMASREKLINAFNKMLATETSSSFWIDNRGEFVDGLIIKNYMD